MANSVLIKIKGDISNLEQEIKKAEDVLSKTQKEVAKQETTLARQRELHQDQIKKYKNALDTLRKSTEFLNADYKKQREQVRELKAEHQDLLKISSLEINSIQQTIVANKERIKAQQSAIAGNHQEIKTKQKLVEIDRTYRETIKKTDKEIIKFRQDVKKLLDAKKNGLITTEKYRNSVAKLNTTLKTNRVTTGSIKKSTESMTNSIVRHLRQIETLVIAYYTLREGFRNTIGVGIEVNKMIEDNTMGIAALLSANTQMVLSNGEAVTSFEKFQMGQEIAIQTMEDLRKASIKTYATFPQLTEIFQQAYGQTLSMGDAFGTTVDEINKNTIKLAQRMSNIGGAIGQPMDRIREEIRSLLSGNASTDSLIATMIFGSPGEANKAIRMAKQRGERGVSELLDGMLAPYDALAEVDTFTRSVLTLQDAWQNTMRDLSAPVFQDLKELFKDIAKDFNEGGHEISETFRDIYEKAKDVSDEVAIVAAAFASYKVGGAIVTSIAGLSTATNILNTSWIALNATMKANPLIMMATAGLTLAGVLGTLQTQVDRTKTDSSEIGIGANTKEEVEKSLKLVENAIKARQSIIEKALAQGKDPQSDLIQLNINYIKDLQKEQETYKKLVGLTTKELEKKSEALGNVKKLGQFLTKSGVDQKAVENVEKIITRQTKSTELQKVISDLQTKINAMQRQADKALDGTVDKENKLALIKKFQQAQDIKKKELNQELTKQYQEKVKQANEELKIANEKYERQQRSLMLSKEIEGGTISKIALAQDEVILAQKTYENVKGQEEKEKAQIELKKKILALMELINTGEEKQKILNAEIELQNAIALTLEQEISKEATLQNQINKLSDKLAIETDVTKQLMLQAQIVSKSHELETIRNQAELDRLEKLQKAFEDTKIDFDVSDPFKSLISSIGDMAKEYKAFHELTKDTNKDSEKYKELEEEHQKNQIAGYANLASSISGAFKEGSDAANAFMLISKSAALVSAVDAVLTQGKGDPYTAWARMASMAAQVTALLSNIGGGTVNAGGDDGGASSIQSQGRSYESETDLILSKFDRQIELLESIDRGGTAAAVEVESLVSAFDRSIGQLSYDVAQLYVVAERTEQNRRDEVAKLINLVEGATGLDLGRVGERDGVVYSAIIETAPLAGNIEATLKYISALREAIETIDFALIDRLGKADVAGWIDEALEAVSEYALGMVEITSELKNASEKFKNIYDGITDTTTFQTARLIKAFDEFDKLRGERGYAEYLQEQIEAIDGLNAIVDEDLVQLLLSEDINKINKQKEALNELAEASGRVFENGTKDALDYLESIELVGESLMASVENIKAWEDSFKTPEELLADIANTLGVDVAQSIDELNSLFDQLQQGADGLTDAELDLLEANKDYLESIGVIEEATEDLTEKIEAQRKQLQDQLDILMGVKTQRDIELEAIYDQNKALQEAVWAEEDRQAALEKSKEIIQSQIESQVNAQLDLAKAYKNVQESISDSIANMTSSALTWSDIISSVANIASPEEAESVLGEINSYYLEQKTLLEEYLSYQDEIIEEQKARDIESLENSISKLEIEEDILRNFKDFARDIEISQMQESLQTGALRIKFQDAFEELNEAILAGDEDASELGQRTTEFAQSYLESLQDTSSNMQDFIFEQSRIANLLKSYEGTGETATLDDLKDQLESIQEANETSIEELREFSGLYETSMESLELKVSSALDQLDTNVGVKLTDIDTNISSIQQVATGYLGDNSPIVRWLSTINSSVESISFSEYTARQEAISAYATASDSVTPSSLPRSTQTQSRSELIDAIYLTTLGKMPDDEGYWENSNIATEDLPRAIQKAAQKYAGYEDTPLYPFANGGIVNAPTMGIIGEAGYPEMVTPLKNPNDPLNSNAIIKELQDLKDEYRQMKKFMVKLSANSTRQLNTQRGILDSSIKVEEKIA